MLDPGVGTGAVDVYAWMFGCQFIVFIIIASSWSAFSSPEVCGLCRNVLTAFLNEYLIISSLILVQSL